MSPKSREPLADVIVGLEAAVSAWEAEVTVSMMLGELTTQAMRDVVDTLAQHTPPHAYAALRTMAVLAPRDVASYADDAAARVPSGDAPGWVAELGKAVPGSCHVASDEFGETRVVLCEFSYPDGAHPHGVFAVIDATRHGAVTTLVVDDDPPGKRRRRFEKDAKRRGGSVREVSAAEGGALLRDGIASFRKNGADASVMSSSLYLATARAAVLAPDVIGAEKPWPEPVRLELVDEFLDSPQAAQLRDPLSLMVPRVLVTNCVENLGCDPTLIGPLVLERLLVEVLPRTVLAPDWFGEAIPPAVRAWTEWLAERNKLSGSSRRRLMSSLRLSLLRFSKAWYGPNAHPLRRYVDDLSDADAVVERRVFAIPAPSDRVFGTVDGGSTVELDAASEGDRALIAALEVSARGLSQLRIPSYVAVTRQLWDNDPPAVWEAACRMRDAGRSREAVLDRLARVWDSAGADDDRYAAALRTLS
jgi:hypothetical protein